MKNITKQKRNGFIVALLVAVLACLALITGFTASTQQRAKAESEYRDAKVGIAFPHNEYYRNLFDSVGSCFGGKYNIEYRYSNSHYEQIAQIEEFVSIKVDLILVAPIVPDSISNVLWQAFYEGIEIIVFGDYNANYPKGITYLSEESYYDLGVQHAEWVCSNPLINAYSVINVFYYTDHNGFLYRDGIKNELDQRNITDNVEYIGVSDADGAGDYIENWLCSNSCEINEVVTYSNDIAVDILQRFYNAGYVDSSDGTGIRTFCDVPSVASYSDDPDDAVAEYFAALGELITKTIETILESGLPENATEVNGSYVISRSFLPGYVKYVSRFR